MDEKKVREAIKHFAEIRENLNSRYVFLGEKSVGQAIDILNTTIEALEKQLPKKPIKTTDEIEIRYTDSYRCSNCGGNFSGTGISCFCYHCGQRLDWSESD